MALLDRNHKVQIQTVAGCSTKKREKRVERETTMIICNFVLGKVFFGCRKKKKEYVKQYLENSGELIISMYSKKDDERTNLC